MKKYKVKIPKGYEVANEYSKLDSNENELIVIELKPIKKELPATWEEFYNRKLDNLKGQIEVTGPKCHAFVALWRLVLLRDHYNDGWVPDWEIDNNKYCIAYFKNRMISSVWEGYQQTLVFRSVSLRDEFRTNFRELIETAKPLL